MGYMKQLEIYGDMCATAHSVHGGLRKATKAQRTYRT